MLLKVQHGSKLYGFDHENSDDDYYQVIETRRTARAKYAKQSIVNNIDTMTVDFGTWVNMCQAGVPQALEAAFAPPEFVVFESSALAAYRNSLRCGAGMRDKYFRTIDNFLNYSDFKKNRHALRLALNLRDGLRYGRFNPNLNKKAKIWITYYAKNIPLNELREFTLDFANK